MKYSVWDSVTYGEGEPIVPFSKLFESENLNDIIGFVDENSENRILFVVNDKDIMFDTTKKTYESPNGLDVYERNVLSNKRKLI